MITVLAHPFFCYSVQDDVIIVNSQSINILTEALCSYAISLYPRFKEEGPSVIPLVARMFVNFFSGTTDHTTCYLVWSLS